MENSASLAVKKFEKDSLIVADSSHKEMIVVLQGEVGVYHNERLIRTVGQGSFCCEQSLFLNQEHDKKLVAVTDVFVLAVTRKNINEFFAKYPDAAVSIVETICERLVEVTAELDKLQPERQAEPEPSAGCRLFPKGHGSYTLKLPHNTSDAIGFTKTVCPLCAHNFDSPWVMASKLRRQGTDPDMRIRYKGVEPMYYSIVTCPNCLFSAETSAFSETPKRYADAVKKKLEEYKRDVKIRTGSDRDTFTVFAGYYLALLCTPVVCDTPELTTAGLWLKISRLYDDCKDKKMHADAVKQALDSYNFVYTKVRINDSQSQQVRFLIGELSFKTGDFDTAREFFFMLKSDRDVPMTLKRPAEARLDAIREMKQAETEQK